MNFGEGEYTVGYSLTPNLVTMGKGVGTEAPPPNIYKIVKFPFPLIPFTFSPTPPFHTLPFSTLLLSFPLLPFISLPSLFPSFFSPLPSPLFSYPSIPSLSSPPISYPLASLPLSFLSPSSTFFFLLSPSFPLVSSPTIKIWDIWPAC